MIHKGSALVGVGLLLAAVFVTAPVSAEDDAAEAPEPIWSSSVGLSYVATTGNSDTSSLGLDFSSERRPTPWGLAIVGSFTRSEDSGDLTAEQYLFGIRGSRELNDRWSLFTGASWERDTFSGFENRYLGEAGAEVIALKTDRHTLSFDFGLTWTTEDQILTREVAPQQFEEYTESADWFGGVAGLKWGWTISDNASLAQRLLYYPNFDDSADWRLASDTSVSASLTNSLSLKLSYLVRYRNEPIDDNEDTDTTTKASVVYTF